MAKKKNLAFCDVIPELWFYIDAGAESSSLASLMFGSVQYRKAYSSIALHVIMV